MPLESKNEPAHGRRRLFLSILAFCRDDTGCCSAVFIVFPRVFAALACVTQRREDGRFSEDIVLEHLKRKLLRGQVEELF